MFSISTDEIFSIVSDFSNQLKYGNRFFVEHKVVDIMTEKFKELMVNIDSGTELFRARIDYDHVIINENMRYSNYVNDLAREHVCEQSKEHIEYFNSKYPPDKMNKIKERIRSGFLGFDAENSYIPPITSEGRSQPKYVRYLYTAENFQTAVCEVHPKIGHYVSVAKIRTVEPIMVVDLSHITLNSSLEDILFEHMQSTSSKDEIVNNMIFESIIKLFLNPDPSDDAYILSNYISALVHKLGYDGVKFASTVYDEGKNVTLFHDKCKCVSSTLLKVKGCSVLTEILKIENINKCDLSEFIKHLIPNGSKLLKEELVGEKKEPAGQ